MSALVSLARAEDVLALRSRLVWLIAAAGAAWATVIVVLAHGRDGVIARQDALQAGGASLLLLGGLAAAVALGATAFPRDAHSGYLGLLQVAGAGRAGIAVARVLTRLATLAAIMLLWWAVLEIGSVTLGWGYDPLLTGHALAMTLNTGLALCAAALMASLIGSVAAGVFGVMAYVAAQALVNLKAALDQHAIAASQSHLITPFYVALPRSIVSPMMEDHQRRGITSLAAPHLEVNNLPVIVPASHWLSVVWTLVWLVALMWLTTVGLGRRQL